MTGDGPSTPLPPDAREALRNPENLFGPYIRVRELGRGGFASVHLAYDRKLSRWIALKVLAPAGAEDAERFRREAELAGGLRHPNIAAVFDIGEERGRLYLALEYVEGSSPTGPQTDVKRAAAWIRDAARAVQYAHEQGILHRDLKPQNLMVDGTGRLFVMDFGLARRQDVQRAVTQSVVAGTPPFMAPEQVAGRALDRRCDVYSLGATLYSLLTGIPPFSGSQEQIWKAVLEEDPVPPRRINRAIPRDLEWCIQQAMAKEPPRRYGTAAELADDLDRFLRGEPVHARGPSVPYRLRRFARRHPVAVTAALAMVLLGAALAGAWRWIGRSRSESQRQQEVAAARLYNLYLERARQAAASGNPQAEAALYFAEANRVQPSAYARRQAAGFRLEVPVEVEEYTAAIAAVGPDGRTVISGTPAGFQVLDRVRREVLLQLPQGFLAVTYCSGGCHVAVDAVEPSSEQTRLDVFDVATGALLGTTVVPSDERIGGRPVRRFLGIQCTHTDVLLIELDGQGNVLAKTIQGEVRGRISLPPTTIGVCSPRKTPLLAVGDRTAGIAVHDLLDGTVLSRLEANHGSPITPASFSPDGRLLTTWCEDHGVRTWDWHAGTAAGRAIRLAVAPRAALMDSGGSTLALHHDDGTTTIWDIATGALFDSVLLGHAQFGEDRTTLMVAQGRLLWRWELNEPRPIVRFLDLNGAPDALGFDPDGARVHTFSGGEVRSWDAESGQPLGGPVPVPADLGRLFAFDQGGAVLLGAAPESVRRWDAHTGTPLEPEIRPGAVAVATAPDGRAFGIDLEGLLRDLSSGRTVSTRPVSASLACFAVDAARRYLIAALDDGQLGLLDLHLGQTLATIPPRTPAQAGGMVGPIPARALALSPDGSLMAAQSVFAERVGFGDVESRQLLHTLLPLAGEAHALAFSPDGLRLAAATDGGTVSIWLVDWLQRQVDAETLALEVRLATRRFVDESGTARDLLPTPWRELRARYRSLTNR